MPTSERTQTQTEALRSAPQNRRNANHFLAKGGAAAPAAGLLCGKVRYRVDGETTLLALCHCRDCQRFTGSGFVSVMQVPRACVTVEGELGSYDMAGGSGSIIRRHFCPNCGSSLLVEPFLRNDRINVMVGTLDDPSVFTPTTEIFCDEAFAWLHDTAARKQFPRGFVS